MQIGQMMSQNLVFHSQSNIIIIYQTLNLRGFEMFANKNQLQQQSEHQLISYPQVNQVQTNPPLQQVGANDEEHIGIQIHKLQSSLQLKRESIASKSNILYETISKPQLISPEPMFQTFKNTQKDSSGNPNICLQVCMNLPVQSTNKLQILTDMPIQFLSYGKPEAEEYEIDFQLNDSELPLASMNKYGNTSSFQEPSESSDDINYYARGDHFNSITFFNEKKDSEDLSSSELVNCRKCHMLEQTNKELINQINELTKELSFLKLPMVKSKIQDKSKCVLRSTNSHDDGSSNISIQMEQHHTSPQAFLQQLNQLSKVMNKICKNDFLLEMPLTIEERQSFLSFQNLLLNIKKLFQIQQQAKQPKNYNKIHQKYKRLIQGLNAEHREQIDKIGEDFKRFMNLLSEKSEIKLQLQHENRQQKCDKSRIRMRKVKTLVDKQQIASYNQQQHNKQVIELLEINYQKQKNKVKDYERYYRKILAKHNRDVAQLKKQRNFYAGTIRRYEKEFESIMVRMAKSNIRLEINSSDLFKNISQRIFQISNCIPFEQNDEQNLFVPENQTEVYDMLERIRRFYLKIEDFTAKKQREVFMLKRNFIFFLKDLIQNDKVSIRYTIELISSNKELGLDYIKDYVNSLRKRKLYSPKKPVKTNNLSLIKTESYSYTKQQGFDQ